LPGHQDRPDIMQRRRVNRLRAELGLAPVPPHVGTELRTIAPRVCEQVVRMLRLDPAYAALSPDGQMLLISAVPRAVEEFARLVEDRPSQAPPVETMLAEIVHLESPVELCRAALHAASQTLRDVARVLWPHLPHAQSYSNRLDEALARYVKGLCARTIKTRRVPGTAANGRVAREPRVDGLLAMVNHRWGGQSVQLYLSVSTPAAAGALAPQERAQRNALRGLSFVATDHVVTITQHPTLPPRSACAAQRSVVVCVGPVPSMGIPQVYDTALLLLRLIRAGVAAPPSPVQIHAPSLGFLHPSPNEASVVKIRELLAPLTEQRGHRRSALARTLQLCLRTASTAQCLAKQLQMHPHTVHNHIAALRTCYNSDLDFAEDGIAMQAALDLVLPLWQLEATGRAHS
jgi:hypothetical protein